LRAGDVVRLRTPAEILATLDSDGCLEGQPFMPEMLEYFGRSFRVSARVDRACDTVTSWGGVRRLDNTVFLEDLRCSGAAHGGCQAHCRLYWREAWLRSADDDHAPTGAPDSGLDELQQLVASNVAGRDSTPDLPTFRCQATELPRAGAIVSWWNVRSLLFELFNGNVKPWTYVRVATRLVLEEVANRLGFEFRIPFKESELSDDRPIDSVSTDGVGELEPGDLVRVRGRDEILKTLDTRGKNRGLWFDREMLPYCGTTARVKFKVERFVDEPTGRLVDLKSDCYILEGVVCSGERSIGRWFCCREIYPWWRACWLEKLDAGVGATMRSEHPVPEIAAC
jgi:hypothetical protein